MDSLKKIFPLSFKYTKDITSLIIGIIIYVVVGAIGGLLIGLVPLVGWIIGGILDLYVAVGVVLLILAFLKIIK